MTLSDSAALARLASDIRLDDRSKYLRQLVVTALAGGRRGHVGSSMSLIEICRVLYDDILQYKADDPQWVDRDRCILSKGHGCLALYALLADNGFFPKLELEKFCHFEALLGGHPEAKIPGVEATTGALGHGLSTSVGLAIAAKMKKQKHRIFVVIGDGETDEGSIWEAALCAAKHQLDNLIVLVDYNKFQSYGPNCEVLPLEPLRKKWEAFRFTVKEVNGHDVDKLKAALVSLPYSSKKPSLLICHTVKGKGIHTAEGNAKWHHKAKFADEELEMLFKEVGMS